MRQLLQLVIGLLACLAFASALPALFPREKITTYKYYADVKTGTTEPTPFASQMAIAGLMHVTPEINFPNLKNAFYVSLDVTHGIRNGKIDNFERLMENTQPIPDAAKVLKDPFVVVFEDNGKLKHLIVNEHEAEWSRNMKRSIAAMLQLDLSSMHLEMPMKPQGFVTNENTIYGECTVAYDVHDAAELGEKYFMVTKIMEPMSCTNFDQGTFDADEGVNCYFNDQGGMTSASRRVFHIEKNGEDLLIKRLVAHGVIDYFPWNANSEAHYVLVNQTMEYDSMGAVGSIPLPVLDAKKTATLNDVSFQKSQTHYGDQAGIDFTYGRHVIDIDALKTKVPIMLGEAVDYMKENHLEMKSPSMEQGQIINRIIDTLSYMDLPALEEVFSIIESVNTTRNMDVYELFTQLIPYVGTNAGCLFIEKIVRNKNVANGFAVTMLSVLPFRVRVPSEELLVAMESLMNFGDGVAQNVRQAGILSFGTLIYKTQAYLGYKHPLKPELISKYVQHYFDHVMSEPSYEMKMIYIQGMKNIGIGDVHKLLEPIVRGDVTLSDKPDHLRLQAMLVYSKTPFDPKYVHDLFWPILANTKLPLILRISAYMILLEQPPRMEQFMNLYWFMVNEKNDHLYNLYYKTMKALANLTNPFYAVATEMASKFLRVLKVRPAMSTDFPNTVRLVSYENKEFGFGEAWNIMTVADEYTGSPLASVIDYFTVTGKKLVNRMTVHLIVEGVNDLVAQVFRNITTKKHNLSDEKIETVLRKAGEDMRNDKPLHIQLSVMVQGRYVMTIYHSEESSQALKKVANVISNVDLSTMFMDSVFTHDVKYDVMYTRQVPNDLGLPTIFNNKVPNVRSLQLTLAPLSLGFKADILVKNWRHGYHSMEVYNPILDTWHAVRRVSAFDVSIPISFGIDYNLKARNFQLILPRLPLTEYSVTGMRSHVKNYVMVIGAEDAVLEQHCPNCHSRSVELVTRGSKYKKDIELLSMDSKSTGLRFSMYQFDCDRVLTPNSHFIKFNDMFDETPNDKSNDNVVLVGLMSLREYFSYVIANPEVGTCGYLTKLEPSTVYPTSEVVIGFSMDSEELTPERLSVLTGFKTNFRGTLDVKAVSSNASVQTWNMTGYFKSSEGHFDNEMQVQISRTTPGEKDLMICIEGSKTYPVTSSDPLSRDVIAKPDTFGQLNVTVGETEDGTCVHDGASVHVEMHGKMSDDQKQAIEHEMTHGMCQKDVENPLYFYKESSVVPRTLACLREALLRTTLRNYIFDVSYKNIPKNFSTSLEWILDSIRADGLPYSTYLPAHTEPGQIKAVVEFSLDNNVKNLTIRDPNLERQYVGVPNDDDEDWSRVVDNISFDMEFLGNFRNTETRFCTIYPEILLNTDGGVMPYIVPDKWTLLTADYRTHMFSVFVKRIEPKKLGLLMTVATHTVEVIPSGAVPTVSIDGKVVEYENGVVVPKGEESHDLVLTWNSNPKSLVIKSPLTSFDLEWTERSVTLVMNTVLQGTVVGLCGHLDGTQKERMAKTYTFSN